MSRDLFVINVPLDARRRRCAELLLALRRLNAGAFTVNELALVLGVSPSFLDDPGLTQIEVLAELLLDPRPAVVEDDSP